MRSACIGVILLGGALQGTSSTRCAGDLARRVECWQQLGLLDQAQQEVERWLGGQSDSAQAWGYKAILHARRADSAELKAALEVFERANSEKRLYDHVLEEVAWATLQEASRHGTLQQRVSALMGQMVTRDTRALPALHEALVDPSPVMRTIGAQMTPMCWDIDTSLLLEKRLKTEQQPDVKVALIQALGRCGTPYSLADLLRAGEKADAQEQLAALEAVTNHMGDVPFEIIEKCVAHPRAGMRALGASLALHLPQSGALSHIVTLMKDPQVIVRNSAWNAVSNLSLSNNDWSQISPFWKKMEEERDLGIRVTAASIALKFDPEQAGAFLRKVVSASSRPESLRGMSAILKSGSFGVPLLREIAQKHPDRIMRMNALVGCLSQRTATQQSLDQLIQELKEVNERLMPLKGGGLVAVAPSEVGHIPGIPNFPEAMDLMMRLRLAHLICSCGGPLPVDQISQWLEEKRWGLTAAAAELLLSEGDAAAVQSVREVLNHPLPKVRFQAALVLAVIGKDEAALDHLLEAAQSGDPEIELQVIDAAGSLASRKLLPLLVQKLCDPSPQIRLMAAASILQVLAENSQV